MITNLTILCPGCVEAVRLRISIGRESKQEFYFVCPHCGSASRGSLGTDQEAGSLSGLEVDGRPARFTEVETDAVVNIFTDLPVDPDATTMDQFGGSPFLMHYSLLGESFEPWNTAVLRFGELVDTDWPHIRRWWGYYLRRDWDRFDEHARRYYSDSWPDEPSMLQRHDSIHRALDLVFVPLFPNGEYPRWKVEVQTPQDDDDWSAACSFASSWSEGGAVSREAQERLFDVVDHFVASRWAWQPGLILAQYQQQNVEIGRNWRIMRDDFRELRDLFNLAFERSHQQLPTLMGFRNAMRSGRADLFPDGKTRSISRLRSSRAVDREAALAACGGWGPEIVRVLDRKLRNDIGHADAVHDLVEGTVTSSKRSVPYQDFVLKVATSVQVPLLLLNTIKLMLILQGIEEK